MRSLAIFTSILAVASAASAQQYPQSSTLPRPELQLNENYVNVGVHGYGSWRVAAPEERLPAGPAGTVPTARVAYQTYMDTDAAGVETIRFRRSVNGGFSWSQPIVLHTLVAGEVIDSNETRLVCSEHDVFVVFASNAHTLAAGQQAVFCIGSEDQGQTWTPATLVTPMFLGTLRDADEVNAVVSRGTSGEGSCSIVFEADTFVAGTEDIWFVQAAVSGGALLVTVPETRLNHAVVAQSSDVNFTDIDADGPVLHVVWTDNRAGGGTSQYDYFSMTSQANGADWPTVTEYRHTQFAAPLSWAAPRRPRAAVDLPHVYTFMEHSGQSPAPSQDDVVMDWSADIGMTWFATGVIVNTATVGILGDIDDMMVTADNGRVAVLYVDDRLNGVNDNDNNQAIVSVSYNAGMDFVMGTHVEVPLSLKDPNPIFDLQMRGDVIAALYETNCGAGGEDFTVSLSADAGATFTDFDVTEFGSCGTFPGGVDVDNPRMALTANGDAIVTWIDDRTFAGAGGGNGVNNLWTSGIKYPRLIDDTANNGGIRYQDDSPAAAGDFCYVLISASGTGSLIPIGNLGLALNLGYDVFTDASLLIAELALPSVNRDLVGLTGAVDFPFFPNASALFGIPIWAAALTITPAAQPGKFTDPIRFQ